MQPPFPPRLPPVTRRPWRFRSFPIVAWWGPPGTARREDFQAYKDARFNLYAANPDTGFERAMEYAASVRLSVLAYRQCQGFILPAQPTTYPNRKNIVGWITNDEPSGADGVTAAITAINTLMREDPTRWAFFNLLPPGAQQNPDTEAVIRAAVENGLPLLSYDSYVLRADGSDATEAHFRYLEQFRAASLRYDTPFWAFALSIKHLGYRRPSESDVRWNHFTNLAYGAKGLWYFTYWGPTDWKGWDNIAIVDPKDGAKTAMYEWVKTLNQSISQMGDILLRLTSRSVQHTQPPAGQAAFVPGREWIADIKATDALIGFFDDKGTGRQYALVVNKRHGKELSTRATREDIMLTFAANVRAVRAVNWLGGKTGLLSLDKDKATVPLDGGTGVLLRLEP